MGLQCSDDITVVRCPDPLYVCTGEYCYHINEGGDRGKFGMGSVRGRGDIASG